MNRKSLLFRLITFVLIVALIIPVNATATSQIEERGSYYLTNYLAYCCPMGAGRVNVYFEVIATGLMDENGVLSITLYESVNNEDWYWVRTYQHDSYPGMLGYNSSAHAGHVTYYGIPGRYYKAYVGVWAGKNGGGDSRYFWTSPKQA